MISRLEVGEDFVIANLHYYKKYMTTIRTVHVAESDSAPVRIHDPNATGQSPKTPSLNLKIPTPPDSTTATTAIFRPAFRGGKGFAGRGANFWVVSDEKIARNLPSTPEGGFGSSVTSGFGVKDGFCGRIFRFGGGCSGDISNS